MSIRNITFIGVFIVLSSLFYVWQRTQNLRLGYEISSLRAQCDELSQENVNLQLKVSSYLAMEKLYKVAKDKGLFVPEEKNIIYLGEK